MKKNLFRVAVLAILAATVCMLVFSAVSPAIRRVIGHDECCGDGCAVCLFSSLFRGGADLCCLVLVVILYLLRSITHRIWRREARSGHPAETPISQKVKLSN